MARLYADEQFPYEVVENLRDLGHDVLTVQEAEKANQKIPDNEVLEFASNNERAVLTLNRKDFKRLHRSQSSHAGIIICTDDANRKGFAERIHAAILEAEMLGGTLISVVRPMK
jgi:predicted nuclease of predicted toxin-antitoxin system